MDPTVKFLLQLLGVVTLALVAVIVTYEMDLALLRSQLAARPAAAQAPGARP